MFMLSEHVEFKVKNVTPIYTSRGRIDRSSYIDISGLSIKGYVRRFYRIIYHPFISQNDLMTLEKEIFGGSGDKGHAGLYAFHIEPLTKELNPEKLHQKRIIAVIINKKTKRTTKIREYTIPEDVQFSVKIWRHLYFHSNVNNKSYLTKVLRGLEAWLLFGGYGRRSRKGLGSFVVEKVSGKLCGIKESDSIFHDIDPNKWSSVSEISKLIERLFEKIQKEERVNKDWHSVISGRDIWDYKHPVISKYSVIAVGDTGEYDYTGAIRFIHHTFKEYKNAPYMKYFVGLSGSGRNPSQLMISLKRGDENSTYKFVLLFAPWIKNLPLNTQKNIVEDAQKNVLEKLDDLRKKGVEVRVLYP